MTRADSAAPSWPSPDPFSREHIEDRMRPSPDPVVVDLLCRVRAVRQMPASEVRRRAKTIPLGERPMRSHVPTETRTSRDEVAIATDDANHPAGPPPGGFVQGEFRPATPDAACAYETLLGMKERITEGTFAEAHGCSVKTAQRWLQFFKAKGVLRRRERGIGHEIVGGGK